MLEAGNLHTLLEDTDPNQNRNLKSHVFSKNTNPAAVLKDAIVNQNVPDKKILQMYVELSREPEFDEKEFKELIAKNRRNIDTQLRLERDTQGRLAL